MVVAVDRRQQLQLRRRSCRAACTDFLLSPSWWQDYCNDDSSVTATSPRPTSRRRPAAIKSAILNIRQAMANAGYADIAVHDHRAGLLVADPERVGLPLLASRATPARPPAAAASGTTTPTGPTTPRCRRSTTRSRTRPRRPGWPTSRSLELQSAFNGRRLCENTVGLLEEKGLTSWTQAGAVDKTEWVNQIRTVVDALRPYQLQETLHPNYWGQLALRNCVRQAYNGGAPRGGTCTIAGTGLNGLGEPNMALS